jgi:hypothetical protein
MAVMSVSFKNRADETMRPAPWEKRRSDSDTLKVTRAAGPKTVPVLGDMRCLHVDNANLPRRN